MRPINLIVIHCSASPNDRTLFEGTPGKADFRNPAQVIDKWHFDPPHEFRRSAEWRARQNPNLAAIGYHYLIGRDGTTFTGRHVDEIPAQAVGFNQKAIGICLVGLDQFEQAQFETLAHLVVSEIARITGRNGPGDRNNPLSRAGALRLAEERGIHICGHRDLPKVRKTCPGFEVSTWLANGMEVPNETPA